MNAAKRSRRSDRRSIEQLLCARGDDALAGLEPFLDDVVVAGDGAERDRLAGVRRARPSAMLGFGDEHEVLPVDALHGDDRHDERCRDAARSRGPHVLRRAQAAAAARERALDQHRLRHRDRRWAR